MKRKIGFWIALASGLVVFPFIYSFSYLPMDNKYMWMGMIPMMMYFATGKSLDKKTYIRMFGSYICGLVWGQVANLIFHFVFPHSPFMAAFLATGILIFIMIYIHLGFLKDTPFDFLSCIYLGFAYTTGFWGRPYPYAGKGFMGDMSTLEGVATLFGVFCFGMALAFGIDLLSTILVKRCVMKAKAANPTPPPAPDAQG